VIDFFVCEVFLRKIIKFDFSNTKSINIGSIKFNRNSSGGSESEIYVGGCIQKFPDWPSGARTANGTALCH
jgi:hypothetical protein